MDRPGRVERCGERGVLLQESRGAHEPEPRVGGYGAFREDLATFSTAASNGIAARIKGVSRGSQMARVGAYGPLDVIDTGDPRKPQAPVWPQTSFHTDSTQIRDRPRPNIRRYVQQLSGGLRAGEEGTQAENTRQDSK
ncbi:hypothetical protein DPEC_G00081130 [Dallia pectoralis]|uniref:Uncharacterized protein n=1 Tax=Dallia pectoralis TaxID=75939 RepID=A0ACC2GYU5_DALPE|nr:hypothetical protein DPEC_G00081130 [Dallia pectoralis]